MYNSRYARNNEVLDDNALMQLSPSVFASTPHHAMSERYGFIPTIDVVKGLRQEGWQPFYAREQLVRIDDRRGFTKHIVRFRHPSVTISTVGDTLPELVLLNSHDGSSAYQMHAGLLRLVCLNGLMVSDTTFSRICVRHTGDVVGRVIDGACTVVRDMPQIAAHIGEMRRTILTPSERVAFASSALLLKYDSAEASPVVSEQLLRTRRYADNAPDLWTTFNVVQENLIRGGLLGRSSTGRRLRTREVKSINEDTRINKALWQLTERVCETKEAA